MRLRLLTLNVWGLPAPLSHAPLERARAIGDRLAGLELDAAAFQEVWSEELAAALVERGARAGLAHAWTEGAGIGNSGLVVLSRSPIRAARFEPFLLCGLPQRVTQLDYWGGKGFVSARIATPAGDFDLVGTHLHAAYGATGHADEFIGHRMAEIVQLARAIASTDLPVALLGDLNAYSYRAELSVLRGATGLVDVARAVGNAQASVVPESPYRPRENAPGPRIDYVLARAGEAQGLAPVDARRVLDEELLVDGVRGTYSDHAGVLAELELGGPGSPPPAADPGAIERARRTLAHGRRIAAARRRKQQVLAGGGFALAAASALGTRALRRSFVRALGYAAASIAFVPSTAALSLAELFTPSELAAYDRVDELLAELEALRGAA